MRTVTGEESGKGIFRWWNRQSENRAVLINGGQLVCLAGTRVGERQESIR